MQVCAILVCVCVDCVGVCHTWVCVNCTGLSVCAVCIDCLGLCGVLIMQVCAILIACVHGGGVDEVAC